MDWDTPDDETLVQQVDAWLTALRGKELSDRRIRGRAGLLGQTMSEDRSQTPEQERVLRLFKACRRNQRINSLT